MRKNQLRSLSTLMLFLVFGFTACVHAPIPGTNSGNNSNTGNNNGNGNNGTDSLVAGGCNPDTVYFQNDILPIFLNTCAISGCHDAATAREGLVLDNYSHIVNNGKLKKGKPNSSEMYRVMNYSGENRMPPKNSGVSLSQDQINMVYTWILQGAQNNSCNANAGGCDTSNMSFASNIQPILNKYCTGCHNSSLAQKGVRLDNYNGVVASVNSGQLVASIEWQAGYTPMPYGGNQLDQCTINKIKSWINNGAKNN